MNKWIYEFSANKVDGNKDKKKLLGGKGANLAEMCSLNLPVPPGFTIVTDACLNYFELKKTINDEIKEQTLAAIKNVEMYTGKEFGSTTNPLLFSVRSGSRVSMPGMMDTVLNLGLNDETVIALATNTKNPRFAWDSYRRFIQMFANVVMGVNTAILEANLEDLKEARKIHEDTDLSAEDWEELVDVYKQVLLEEYGLTFPQSPYEQLWMAISAVFNSWYNPRATKYREMNQISDKWGTAVNVQSMVFGNTGFESATGVCFTRDPSTGEKVFYGEYLLNAQGEDVVAGIRTPLPINKAAKKNSNVLSFEEAMPETYQELVAVYEKLEAHYKDMQDIEFTVENKKLYILQTRNGKRTISAALKIAIDLVSEGILNKNEAIMRINPEDLNNLLHPRLDPSAPKHLLATGLPASPGAACGQIVFLSEDAIKWKEAGKSVILVRQETSPEDIGGMDSAIGILTARGGMTSHAAVVARGMGKPCVAGCKDLLINEKNKTLMVNGHTFSEGDYVTFDGGTGEIFKGIVPTTQANIDENFTTLMSWADEIRRLKVRANAETPEDAITAIKFGAQGIGLCRTEHMFFAPERILAVREMIFAQNVEERKKALNKILPFQKNDFIKIFEVMHGKPVNIRLLDPPLHEFLPQKEHEMQELGNSLGIDLNTVKQRIDDLHEFNPMLGHRGCRLAVTYPEIYEMQVQAIMEAALECQSAKVSVIPEIMIPLVGTIKEFTLLKEDIEIVIKNVFTTYKKEISYKIGTMLELPRACILAGEIAPFADFFSFGTNDLTQTTYGLSRDDSGRFLKEYIAKEIYPIDPFVSLDKDGVGFLVDHAVTNGKAENKNIHMGICGEHGGDPASIEFCHQIGLDYVSCSPYRIPIARLSAARAALEK